MALGEGHFALEHFEEAQRAFAVVANAGDEVPPSDLARALYLGMLLDQQGIAVRTGHHCAQPLMDRYGIPGTARASYAIYNTQDDVEALFAGIRKAKSLFG